MYILLMLKILFVINLLKVGVFVLYRFGDWVYINKCDLCCGSKYGLFLVKDFILIFICVLLVY